MVVYYCDMCGKKVSGGTLETLQVKVMNLYSFDACWACRKGLAEQVERTKSTQVVQKEL